MDYISEVYDDLLEAHAEVEILEAAVTAAENAMHATEEGQAYLQAVEELKGARAEEDARRISLNAAALEAYEESGEKRPHPQVQIRIRRTPFYDPARALAWATERQPDFVLPPRIDRRRFEKYARAVLDVAPLDFVTFREAPTVAVSLNGGK